MADSDSELHVIVEGRVQGVFFRKYTTHTARKLGLVGWVRNCVDGNVEVFAAGPKADLKSLLEWLHHGPRMAAVVGVRSVDQDPESEAIMPDQDVIIDPRALVKPGQFYVYR